MTGPWYIELYRRFPDYDREPYVQNTAREVEFIEREIGHARSKLILDVGCGTGRHALELARHAVPVPDHFELGVIARKAEDTR